MCFLGGPPYYDKFVAYLLGWNDGKRLLEGFGEWVELRLGRASSKHWMVGVLELSSVDLDKQGDDDKLDVLCDTVAEFLVERRCAYGGLPALFGEWHRLEAQQTPLDPEEHLQLQRFGTTGKVDTCSVDEAAVRLGIDRQAIYALLAGGTLDRSGWVDGQLRTPIHRITVLQLPGATE